MCLRGFSIGDLAPIPHHHDRHIITGLAFANKYRDIGEQVRQQELGAAGRAGGDGQPKALEAVQFALRIGCFDDTIDPV